MLAKKTTRADTSKQKPIANKLACTLFFETGKLNLLKENPQRDFPRSSFRLVLDYWHLIDF
ncbi:hypothetical protein BDA96_05G191200 [Sorghum bicolor]|uniref:Uncharacterized protein n=2 Tax=Sorghum bicolor TaxID=4558 RepID=A0A1B6PT56_SORBI|nr:hypothetical protein BDA96_05G191200 [Sorghum bicolor]KXG28854.1 hypothetical protein SORBI_3005G175400 [Sorghum bicolor]KXG28855.1 hypothetical protein SORBI_3005G175400 [Sorghum bicolor]